MENKITLPQKIHPGLEFNVASNFYPTKHQTLTILGHRCLKQFRTYQVKNGKVKIVPLKKVKPLKCPHE